MAMGTVHQAAHHRSEVAPSGLHARGLHARTLGTRNLVIHSPDRQWPRPDSVGVCGSRNRDGRLPPATPAVATVHPLTAARARQSLGMHSNPGRGGHTACPVEFATPRRQNGNTRTVPPAHPRHRGAVRIILVYSAPPSATGGIETTMREQRRFFEKLAPTTFLASLARADLRPRHLRHAWRRFTRLVHLVTAAPSTKRPPRVFVLHGFSDPTIAPFMFFRRGAARRLIWQPHMHPFATHAHPLLAWLFFTIIGRPVGRNAERIVAINQAEATFLKQAFGADEVTLIPQVVASGTTEGTNEEATPPRPYLLFVGRDDANKRLDALLNCLHVLTRRGFDLVVVSDTARTLPDGVVRNAHVSNQELRVLYRNATFTVVPSRHEAFSLVGLESLLMGTPVLATPGVQLATFDAVKPFVKVYDGSCNALAAALDAPHPRMSSDDVARVADAFSEARYQEAWTTLLNEVVARMRDASERGADR